MAILVLGSVTLTAAGPAQAASKVTICHRTHSTTNPYRQITVAQSATVAAGKARNHAHHTGPAFVPGHAYPPNAKVWGDIIPFSAPLPAGVTCGALTAAQFYNIEREAGQSHAAVVADLTEQEAEADIAAGLTNFSSMTYSGTWSATELATAERAASGEVVVPDPGTPATTDPGHPESTDTGEPPAPDAGTETEGAPADHPSGEQPPADPAPVDPTPTDPSDAPPVDTDPAPVDPPTGPTPGTDGPTEPLTDPVPTPVDPSPAGPGSGPGGPGGTPSEPTPVDPAPTGPTPVDPAPVDPTPGDPAPSDPTPVDPAPGEPPVTEPPPTGPSPADPAPGADPGDEEPATATDPAPPAGSQRIDGTVWLDLDRDGKRDADEVGVPGARVQLFRLAPATFAAVQVPGGAGVGGVLAAWLAPVVAGPVEVRTTDANGAFAFADLPTGTYRVAAARPAALTVTFDGDDELDAASEMDLPIDGHGVADVGLVGDSALDVRTVTASGQPLADGDVGVRWAGLDGELDTDDDVVLPAFVVAGEVHLAGLPAGSYRVEQAGGALASQPLVLSTSTSSPTTATLAEPGTEPIDTPDGTGDPSPTPDGAPAPEPSPTPPLVTDPVTPSGPSDTSAEPGSAPTQAPTADPVSSPIGAQSTTWANTRIALPLGARVLTPVTGVAPAGLSPATARGTLAATGAAPERSAWAAAALMTLGGAMLAVRRRLAARR